jgi:hypothetical protein
METRTGRVAALALLCTIVMAPRSQLVGQVASRADVMRTAPVFATDTSLQAALSRIAAGSRSWRAALDSVSVTGRMVLVVTPEEVIVVDDPENRMTDAFDTTSLAEAAPVVSTDGAVNVVLAVINLPLLDRLHAELGTTRAEYEADLERLLIHEIYSHAVPYLIEGNITGRCPDPVEGQKALEACSIRRENRIRAELGLGMRKDYGVSGLVLGRRP